MLIKTHEKSHIYATCQHCFSRVDSDYIIFGNISYFFFFNNFLLVSCPSRCFHYQFVTKNYYFHHMWQRIISLFLPSPRKFFFFLKLKSSCCGKSGIIFTRIVNRKYLKSCSNLFVCCFVSLDRFYFPYMSSCTYYNTHIFRNVF